METAIAIPDADRIERQAMTALQAATALVITDDTAFQEAGAFLRSLKTIQKAIDETFDGPIRAAHAAHKAIVAAKASHYEPVARAESIVKQKVTVFQDEEQKRADEERRRLEAESKAKAEAEALAAAIQAEQMGDKETADAIMNEPIAPTPIKAPMAPKADGVSFRDKWGAEVEDFRALVQAVAAGNAPITLLMADQTAIRKFAEAVKGAQPIPGLKFTCQKIASVRA